MGLQPAQSLLEGLKKPGGRKGLGAPLWLFTDASPSSTPLEAPEIVFKDRQKDPQRRPHSPLSRVYCVPVTLLLLFDMTKYSFRKDPEAINSQRTARGQEGTEVVAGTTGLLAAGALGREPQ